LPTSSPTADLWDTIALEAERESSLWGQALLPPPERERISVFSSLGQPRFALGIETIYEGYLLHYGSPRLFAPETPERALLLGDYLYAHGLVRVADEGEVAHVSDLAELISLCAQQRADDGAGEDWAWASTVALLGSGALGEARAVSAAGEEAVGRARAAHATRVR
jgi:hypothetical protein